MFTASKGVLEGYGYEQTTLTGAGQEVRIMPCAGFNLYYWTIEGKEILMEPTDITQFGSKYGIPVLFPTPNRIKDGVYTWQGKQYTMTKRGKTILRHGLVMDEPFTVTELAADENCAVCAAEIDIRAGDALHEGYPFPCTLSVRYTLDEKGVHMHVSVKNDGENEMPFGFALHPYFSKRGNADMVFLTVPCKRVYETDDALIPTGRILPAGEGQRIADGYHSVQSLYLDHVFRGMTADLAAKVQYEDVTLRLVASDCFRNAVVYTPHDRPGFCIEPQTNATNAVNLYAEGLIDESGLLILPAGRTFEADVHFYADRR